MQVPPSEMAPDGYTILIDGGPGSKVMEGLSAAGVSRVDAVFLTHPDADHLSGLLPVLNRYPVGTVYDSGMPASSTLYRDFLKLVDKKKIYYQIARKGQYLTFGQLEMEVLNPGDNLRTDETNANSIVLMASYQGLDILFPGDAEGDVLCTLDLNPVEVFKVPHHGSGDSYLKQVLDTIGPQEAIISVGAGNSYGHPAQQTLDALKAAGARIHRTDRQGTVKVAFVDGVIEISTEE